MSYVPRKYMGRTTMSPIHGTTTSSPSQRQQPQRGSRLQRPTSRRLRHLCLHPYENNRPGDEIHIDIAHHGHYNDNNNKKTMTTSMIFLMFTDLDEMVFTLVRLQQPPRDEHWGRVPHEVVPTRSYLRRPTYSSTGYFQILPESSRSATLLIMIYARPLRPLI